MGFVTGKLSRFPLDGFKNGLPFFNESNEEIQCILGLGKTMVIQF